MARTDEGCIVLANLAFDIHVREVSVEFLGHFFDRLAVVWAERGDMPEDQMDEGDPASETFDQVRREMSAEINCLGRPTITGVVEVSSIMPAPDFLQMIDRKKIGGRAYRPIPCESELTELARIKPLDSVALANAVMPPQQAHRRRIAWVTPTQGIRDIRSTGLKGPKLAETLRARLGLIHHIRRPGKDPIYVEVCYSANGIAMQTPLTPPTVFDAGSSMVYRSQQNESGWGATIDLHNGEPGLPEAVHLPVPFQGFVMEEVGKPGDLILNISPSELAKSSPVPWGHCCIAAIEEACSAL
jgi:hypothetical protein